MPATRFLLYQEEKIMAWRNSGVGIEAIRTAQIGNQYVDKKGNPD
jgi:hypothetical protein